MAPLRLCSENYDHVRSEIAGRKHAIEILRGNGVGHSAVKCVKFFINARRRVLPLQSIIISRASFFATLLTVCNIYLHSDRHLLRSLIYVILRS